MPRGLKPLRRCPFCGVEVRLTPCGGGGYHSFSHPPTRATCPVNLHRRKEGMSLFIAPEDVRAFVTAWNRRADDA